MSDPARPAVQSARFIAVRPEWLALWEEEEILEPARPIVDAHHHIWERPGWRYMFDDLRADLESGHNVVATVYLEAGAMYRADGPAALRPVGETEFANGVAAMAASGTYGACRVCAGIVGHADLRLGERVQEVLEAHLRAGGGRFRGVRQVSAWDPDAELVAPVNPPPPGLLLDGAFQEGFARLGPLGLSFDAWLYHHQIDDLAALARRFPDTPVVLDHVGGALGVRGYAGKRDEVFAAWARSLRGLAACPNAYVKVGGMGMKVFGFDVHEQPRPPSSEVLAAAWRPYVETCVEAFGAGRCMFESNFPVDKGSYTYAAYWNACKRLAQDASSDEKADLFGGTAARVYRLEGTK